MIIKKMKLSVAVVAMAGMILTSAPVNAAPKETAKPAAEDQKKENNQAQSKYADKVLLYFEHKKEAEYRFQDFRKNEKRSTWNDCKKRHRMDEGEIRRCDRVSEK